MRKTKGSKFDSASKHGCIGRMTKLEYWWTYEIGLLSCIHFNMLCHKYIEQSSLVIAFLSEKFYSFVPILILLSGKILSRIHFLVKSIQPVSNKCIRFSNQALNFSYSSFSSTRPWKKNSHQNYKKECIIYRYLWSTSFSFWLTIVIRRTLTKIMKKECIIHRYLCSTSFIFSKLFRVTKLTKLPKKVVYGGEAIQVRCYIGRRYMSEYVFYY